MNLQKLFKAQAELDKHIIEKKGLQGVDLLPNLILALQVELGECAQESRCFKFWSSRQEPVTEDLRVVDYKESGEAILETYNPLLEEYVDCLHFILSIGNQIKFDREITGRYINDSITEQFNSVFEDVSNLMKSIREDQPESDLKSWYEELVKGIIGLGEMLGFSWGQIEDAYFSKNAVNHSRQENGY
ncbi:dUTPase [Heyndrickxia coagulans]|uniref:dUTP diphosphatase n=1 Tax=Heyndrickxia coagulans TaxID=1398 RepID=UPI000D733376|nr:dUTP diphosphatase [Heyndrickxia coagulans]AWP37796.1 dUTPase [Heyndrickxia coagulans]QDI60109.1 dUTPase [Heyndrickxia coagulans]